MTRPTHTESLPELGLPLLTWLLVGPAGCMVVGLIAVGLGLAIPAIDGMAAALGAAAMSVGSLVGAVAVLPWEPRPLNQWAMILLGGQGITIVAAAATVFAVDAAVSPSRPAMLLTAAASFFVVQFAQISVFSRAARPIQHSLRARHATPGGGPYEASSDTGETPV